MTNGLTPQNITGPVIIDKLAQSLAFAETGGNQNPNIRTTEAPKGGSSAYGKYQLTGGEGSMVANILRDKSLQTRLGITPDELQYLKDYKDHAINYLLKYGNEPNKEGYDPIYDYGGVGHMLNTDDQKALYDSVGRKIIDYEYNVQAKGDLNIFLKNWKMGSSKSMDDFNKWVLDNPDAQEYVNRFSSTYAKPSPVVTP